MRAAEVAVSYSFMNSDNEEIIAGIVDALGFPLREEARRLAADTQYQAEVVELREELDELMPEWPSEPANALAERIGVVERVLDEIHATTQPRLLVFNKSDLLLSGVRDVLAERYPDAVFISALTGEDLDVLCSGAAIILWGLDR